MKYTKQQITLASAIPELGMAAGQTVTLALAPADVNTQEELDSFLAGPSPYEFRADEVAPVFLVDKDTDKFRVYSDNNAFQQVNVIASLQAGVRQVDPETSLDDYRVVERALGNFMPAATLAQASFDVQAGALRRIRWALELDREIRVWNLLTASANWAANNYFSAGTVWTNVAADPIADLQSMIDRSSQPIGAFWMSPNTSAVFLRNPNVRDHMRQMLGDNAPPTDVQNGASVQARRLDYQIPGLPPIRIASGRVKNETTNVLDPILGNDFVVGVTAPTMEPGVPNDGQSIQTIQTFRRRGPSGTGFTTREFFVDERGLDGGNMMVGGHAEDVKFISTTAGCLLDNVNP